MNSRGVFLGGGCTLPSGECGGTAPVVGGITGAAIGDLIGNTVMIKSLKWSY